MLEKIKESCYYVMDNSKYVTINYSTLDDFIKDINPTKMKYWLSNNPYSLFDLGIEDIVNFLLIFESIDYSFWGSPKWTIETIYGDKDGTDALLYVLLNYVKVNGCFNFDKISLDQFNNILKGNVEIPLLKERYNTLVDISKIVNNKMNGSFYKYIENITRDIDLFNVIINNFPSFKDEREYRGHTIYFYKLGQLLVSDILHMRSFIQNIDVDYTNLLGCSDYKIPQVLRNIGIIFFDSKLSELVDNGVKISISSDYEVEIRA